MTTNEAAKVYEHNDKLKLYNRIGYGWYVFYDKNEVVVYDTKRPKEKIIECRYAVISKNGKWVSAVHIDFPINKTFEAIETIDERRDYKGYYIYVIHIKFDFDVNELLDGLPKKL